MRGLPQNTVLNVRLTFPKTDPAGNLPSGIFDYLAYLVQHSYTTRKVKTTGVPDFMSYIGIPL